MPRMYAFGPLVAALGIWGAGLPPRTAATANGLSVEQVSWLAGYLELRSGDQVVEEHRSGYAMEGVGPRVD